MAFISRSTFFPADGEYFRVADFFALVFFAEDDFFALLLTVLLFATPTRFFAALFFALVFFALDFFRVVLFALDFFALLDFFLLAFFVAITILPVSQMSGSLGAVAWLLTIR